MILWNSTREVLVLAGDHLWQSTLFAAAATIIAALLRRQAASLRYWVWFAASVKFLVPFAALIALGGYSSWRSVDIVPNREAPVLIEVIGQPFSQDAVTLGTPRPRGTESPVTNWLPIVLLSLWAGGAALFFVRSLWQWRRVRRIAREAVLQTSGREVNLLRALERAAGSAKPLPLASSVAPLEPGIFGVVRPVLLWPKAIGERLTDAQIEAVLLHELDHLRRRDNLTALFHLVVQTVFWFHPLVWWIGARLITERERACDADVIRLGSEREIYAESILKTCQFFVESPIICVSGVTGSDLKKRIEDIMSNDSISTAGVWKKALLTVAGVVAFITPVAVGALNPPTQTRVVQPVLDPQGPVFDVVSIKRNPTLDVNTATQQVGTLRNRLTAPSATLRDLVRAAYNYQFRPVSLIVGGPGWVDTERYQVIGQSSVPFQPPPSRGLLPSEATAMLRAMLADRFQLKIHFEMRERNVYELVLDRPDGRLGPTLTPAKGDCQGSMDRYDPAKKLPACRFILIWAPDGTTTYELSNVTIAELASTIGNYPSINDLVVDRTGLAGRFDMKVRSFEARPTAPGPPPTPGEPLQPTDVAIRQQLGLRLQRARLPVEAIVIDSVERPSAN